MDVHINLMRRSLETLQLEVSAERTEILLRYCEAVIHANSTTNLTGAGSVAEFIEGPLFDALTIVGLLADDTNLVDIGSGAGLPGIPISIITGTNGTTLVEPRKKRVEFLENTVKSLNLEVKVLQTQDRELQEGQFQGAIAQAVFPPKKWLARAKRLVRDGGHVYVLSSEKIDNSHLPPNAIIEERLSFSRSSGNVIRHAGRVKIRKNIAK